MMNIYRTQRAAFKFHHLPPTAFPIKGEDYLFGLFGTLQPQKAVAKLRTRLAEKINAENLFLISSGRAALLLLLKALKRLSDRLEVVIPAYSCPTVVQAVLEAGCVPLLCDVSPKTLAFEPGAIESLFQRDLLAVIPTYLYGIPQDISELQSMGKQKHIWLIEDAAQAFGAKVNHQYVGTLGDAGIYSLGAGKCLPSGKGGVLVVKEQLAPAIAQVLEDTRLQQPNRDGYSLLRFLGYGLATRPSGWWLVARSPLNPARAGMAVGRLKPIKVERLSGAQAGIALSLLNRIEAVQAMRQANVERLIRILAHYSFIATPQIPVECEPVFLRLPIVVKSKGYADKLFDLLNRAGIGVSRSYDRSLAEIYANQLRISIDEFPGAEYLANCLLTLPTHPFIEEQDFSRIQNALDILASLLE